MKKVLLLILLFCSVVDVSVTSGNKWFPTDAKRGPAVKKRE